MATIPLEAAAAAMREAMRDTVKRYSLWYLLQGILMVVAGILALFYHLSASVAFIVLLAWILIISGVVQGIGLVGAQQVPHFWLQLISVVLSVVVGLLLLRQPESGLVVFSVLLIVYFMVEGMAKVIFALTIRPFPNWGWLLGSRIVGILLAVYLWANLSVASGGLLGVLLGIQLLVEGAALTYLAWRIRESGAASLASGQSEVGGPSAARYGDRQTGAALRELNVAALVELLVEHPAGIRIADDACDA